ncbi:MAG: hypothetical protein Q9200_002631 [Gallowayella weberi]
MTTTLNTLPSPISWPPSQFWETDGGSSSFNLRVGTPPQVARVLVSTAGQATWVVSPLGCPPGVSTSCSDVRGWLYDSDKSRTWQELGNFSLGLETNLYPSDNATYGLDSVALGSTDNNGGPNLTNQVVAAISGYEYVLGMFGLGQQPTNLSDFNQPIPSFLTSLYNQKLIPSLSWGYTAGAKYQLKGVFGSLTLGGFDAARFVPNDVSFNLATDISRDLVVGLQGIMSIESNGSTQSLLPLPYLTFIDSTIPYIYLPLDACKAFEQAFGLSWNESYGLYIVDDELHRSLKTRNPTFKFEIGQLRTGGPTVDITLPYGAFDLTYKPNFDSAPLRHFPIQRAQNDSQLTLGRVFLQEAYITTNYELGNFSVSQCKFEEPIGKDIRPIPPAKSSDALPDQPPVSDKISKRLARNQIIGIIMGSLLGFITLIALFWKLFVLPQRRRRMKISSTTALISSAPDMERTFSANREAPWAVADRRSSSNGPLDFNGKDTACIPGSQTNSMRIELPHTDRVELPEQREVTELPLPSPNVNDERLPRALLKPAPNPQWRFGICPSRDDFGRYFMQLIDMRTSQTALSTSERSSQSRTNSYLDRPLPPTPDPETPAWDRVAARQHARLELDPSSNDLHQDRFKHRPGFF